MSAPKLVLSMSSTIGEKISDEKIRRTLHHYGFHGRTPIRKPLIKLHIPAGQRPQAYSEDCAIILAVPLQEAITHSAQSPDLNVIENLWSQLEKAVHEHEITNNEVLKKVPREEWAKLSVETTKALVKSMPRSLQAVIKAKDYATKY
ncbi:hypothetical protein TNCV_2711581 [Trichonephila clavipes]|nr:hypothetical protein TNCV_2711581 [Trichonephila clavipes]